MTQTTNKAMNSTDSPVTKWYLQYATGSEYGYLDWQIWGLEAERDVNNALYDSREDAWTDAGALGEALGEGIGIGDEDSEGDYGGFCDRAFYLTENGQQIESMIFVCVLDVTIKPGEEITFEDIM